MGARDRHQAAVKTQMIRSLLALSGLALTAANGVCATKGDYAVPKLRQMRV